MLGSLPFLSASLIFKFVKMEADLAGYELFLFGALKRGKVKIN